MRIPLCLFMLTLPLVVFAQNLDEQTKRRQEIEKEIAAIDRQIASARADQENELQLLTLIRQKIVSRKDLLAGMDVQMGQLIASIGKKQDEMTALQDEYEAIETSYAHLLYKAYVHRNRQVWVAYILGSQDFRQAYRRWRYFKNYFESMNRQASQIKQVRIRVEVEMSELLKLRGEAEALLKERQRELTALNAEERESSQMIANMSKQEGRLRAQLQQKQNEMARLNREIARILEEAEKQRQTATIREQEIERTLVADFEQNRGKLPWPLKQGGVVDEPYGQHDHPVLTGIKPPFNRGVGISGAQNEEVLAVFQGEVKQVAVILGYNQCVMVQHGSYYTVYCRLGSVQVKIGDSVNVGTVLGRLAERSLHFELWKGKDTYNPELWLRKR